MIELMKLNGETIYLNYFQILSLKAIPETRVKMTTGDFYLVRESIEEVNARIAAFLRSVMLGVKSPEKE